MNPNLRRPITAEEIRTYEEDGVVWLPDILDPEWADYLARGINELVKNPQGQAVDFTNLGLAANTPEAVSGFQARDKWVKGQNEWGSLRQLAGTGAARRRHAAGNGQAGPLLIHHRLMAG